MSIFDIAAILIGLAALFGFLNHRYLKLPHTIGLMLIALAASSAVILTDTILPGSEMGKSISDLLARIDFHDIVMHGMLSFLLFAGALHVDFIAMADRKWTILTLATVGILISTFVIGTALWFVLGMLGLSLSLIWALVFGALISPTDPVAVLGIFKTIDIPPALEAKVAGESLFNDGVGVVVFTILVSIAVGGAHGQVGPQDVLIVFLQEAVGGVVLGLAAGYIGYRAMHVIDEYVLEILISLALVMVTYAIAIKLHMSGPIAMVVAGLFIGNQGARFAMSDRTREHLFHFWELMDEILNSVLFLLIGLEVLVVSFSMSHMTAGILAIPIALLGRSLGVGIPMAALSVRMTFTQGAIPVLIWGGLRGGIAVALALSLPENEFKPLILTATYAVVIFSIVVQGMSMKTLVKRIVPSAS
ncbi:MAG TPA: sodium:proton antiporter [Nitrospirales bacterium]|nr:sodium:proton antiporter [Nitrospirales bacterium]HIO69223.1 sodium:proton antiporter [Nitrospirales bacterium]